MIREALDQWDFVVAAYAVGVIGVLATVAWAWLAMRRAERRRDHARERTRGR
ncbi:hypothetical protein Q9K01_05605 [Qipengyuania sp. DY56-A-20]|jgi:hypothetical protein|uniref:Heme exporter protein D n=1 Tax=Qipengyuania benthica TaxID=3067651 RepID=A0ABT9H7T4_9SPHN|nr:hypothetical protein [Qipengyuania sp. DY56-A-20]MDP4539094.1 hypothetical protein [Qipengyuania sp. DY56-A-20]